VQLRIQGGHQVPSTGGRATSFLIDGRIAIDAGGLCDGLSLADQGQIEHLLLTHYHFDHIADLPFLGLLSLEEQRQIQVHCTQLVKDTVCQSVLNGVVWLNLFNAVPGAPDPAFVHRPIEVGREFSVLDYRVLPIENRHHAVPVTAYQFTTPAGKRLLYTGDTGPGINDIWSIVQPDVMVTEVTMHDELAPIARMVGHLTPTLLEAELTAFLQVKGYLPRILICHANQAYEPRIRVELDGVAQRLQAKIELTREGMTIDL
jgi:3',5'-cyclic-nucleotide phosphodiesterase